MLTKNWEIELIEGNGFDDEGFYVKEDQWLISDGMSEYIFPVEKYPTKADAWKAWESKIM